MTLWAGRIGVELAPEGSTSWLRTNSSTARPTLPVHPTLARARGSLTDDELRDDERTRGDHGGDNLEETGEDVRSRDRAAVRWTSAQEAAPRTLAEHQTTARSGSTSPTRARRPTGARRPSCGTMLDRAGRRPTHRYQVHAPAGATAGDASHHLLASVEILVRDRARLPLRRRAGAGRGRSAPRARGSTLPCPPPPTDPRLDQRRLDRDFALDYLYAAASPVRPLVADRRGDRALDVRRLASRACPARRTGSSMMPQKLTPTSPNSPAAAGRRSAGSPGCSRSSRACRSRTTAICRRQAAVSPRDERRNCAAALMCSSTARVHRAARRASPIHCSARQTPAKPLVREGVPFPTPTAVRRVRQQQHLEAPPPRRGSATSAGLGGEDTLSTRADPDVARRPDLLAVGDFSPTRRRASLDPPVG